MDAAAEPLTGSTGVVLKQTRLLASNQPNLVSTDVGFCKMCMTS